MHASSIHPLAFPLLPPCDPYIFHGQRGSSGANVIYDDLRASVSSPLWGYSSLALGSCLGLISAPRLPTGINYRSGVCGSTIDREVLANVA